MRYGFTSGGRSWQGRYRDSNQDAWLTSSTIAAVADGVGGQAAGDVASATVIESLAASTRNRNGRPYTLQEAQELADAVNRALAVKASDNASFRGMATTLTALFRSEDGVLLAHIGDSRAYLLRNGALQQVSRDDSLVQVMKETHQISAQEAARHPLRSVVLKVLTGHNDKRESRLSLFACDVGLNDRWLIASDGLTDYVPGRLLEEVLSSTADPQECAESLIALAGQHDSQDNITVVVCDIVGEAVATVVRTGGSVPETAGATRVSDWSPESSSAPTV